MLLHLWFKSYKQLFLSSSWNMFVILSLGSPIWSLRCFCSHCLLRQKSVCLQVWFFFSVALARDLLSISVCSYVEFMLTKFAQHTWISRLPITFQDCFVLTFVYNSSLNSVDVLHTTVNLSRSENNYIQHKYISRLFQYFVFENVLDCKWLHKVLIIKDFIQHIQLH